MESFIFGPGTEAPSYEALRKKREVADLLRQQSMADTGTPRNLGEGIGSLSKVVNAIASRYMDHKIAPQEDDERKRISDLLMGGGGLDMSSKGGTPPFAPSPDMPATMPSGPQSMPSGDLSAGQGYMDRLGQIESGWNGGAQNPNSSAGGYFQWTDGTAAQYGVKKGDLASEKAGLERFRADNARTLAPVLGRAPTAAEEYLAHQQGAGGAAKLLSNPDAPAVSVVGQAAVVNNGGDPSMSSRDFAQHVMGYYGGGGGGGQGGAAPPVDMARLSQLAEVMGNPYASEGQKSVAKLLIERMMPEMPEQMSEYQRQSLELQRANQAAEAQGGNDLFGNPIWGKNAQGQDVLGQLGQDGTFHEVKAPDGVSYNPGGVKVVDQGTSSQVIDRSGAPVGAPLAKDVAGVEVQKAVGADTGAAMTGLNNQELSVQAATDLISKIANDPALEGVTGMVQGRMPGFSQESTDAIANVDELTSKTFPLAIEALRGMGALSNMEGIAAKEAVANLARSQGTPQFKEKLIALGQLLESKLAISRSKAGVPQPEAPAQPPAAPWEFAD